MVVLSSWAEENWFNLIQTFGIMGSLWLASSAAHREAKAREVENLLTIADHHRELWEKASENPDLERVFQTDADTVAKRLTTVEEEFLNLVTVHFLTGWRIAKTGGITTLKEIQSDVRAVFSLPLPHAFWEKTKGFRNPEFVRFVEQAMNKRP